MPPASSPCAVFLSKQELKTVLWEGDSADDGLEDRVRVLVPPCPPAKLQQLCRPGAVAQAQREHSWKGAEGAGARQPPAKQGGCWPGRSPLAVCRQHPSHPRDCLVAHGAETPKLHGSGGGHSGIDGTAPLHHLETRHRLLPAGRGQIPDPQALRTHTASGCERHLSAHQVQEERDSQPLLREQWGSRS